MGSCLACVRALPASFLLVVFVVFSYYSVHTVSIPHHVDYVTFVLYQLIYVCSNSHIVYLLWCCVIFPVIWRVCLPVKLTFRMCISMSLVFPVCHCGHLWHSFPIYIFEFICCSHFISWVYLVSVLCILAPPILSCHCLFWCCTPVLMGWLRAASTW